MTFRRTFRRDPCPWILVLAVLLQLGLTVPRLVYPDLNLDYPFMDGDSHDWIAHALRFEGCDVRAGGRSPLFPLTLAALDRVSAGPWLPVLLQVLFAGTVLAFYDLAARLASRPAALVSALALLLNHSLSGLSLQVMADVPASCLLFLGARSFILGGYAGAGTLWGLSAVTQPLALVAAAPAALTIALRRRGDLRSARLWIGAALLVLPSLVWAVVRWRMTVADTADADVTARQLGLLAPDLASVPYYAWAFLSFFGLPACVLLAAGLVLAMRSPHPPAPSPGPPLTPSPGEGETCLVFSGFGVRGGAPLPGRVCLGGAGEGTGVRVFPSALFLSLTGFFVFLYSFDSKRFLVYPAWTAGLLVAMALARLPRAVFAVASVLLVSVSAMPLPGEPTDPAWAALWPLPPVEARAPVVPTPAGGQALAPGPIRVEVVSPAGLSNLERVRAARASFQPGPRFDPALVRQDRSALFLYEKPSDGGGRYTVLTRLGSALRKRVKFVPAAWLEPWRPWLGIERVGRIGGATVYRVRLPDRDGTWLLATADGSAVHWRLEALSGSEPLASTPGFREAQAVLPHLAGWDGYVALVPASPPEPWQLYLPFLVRTTELYAAEPGQENEILRIFDKAPHLGELRVGPIVLRRAELLGRKATLVTGTAAPRR
jgi:hypothetical protein